MTVLATELSRTHPRQAWWIRGSLFGAAALVGVSRITENAHWTSDVAGGAALGVLTGVQVSTYWRRHHRPAPDRPR
jgi:membrane-associated phospholipid phosphatase